MEGIGGDLIEMHVDVKLYVLFDGSACCSEEMLLFIRPWFANVVFDLVDKDWDFGTRFGGMMKRRTLELTQFEQRCGSDVSNIHYMSLDKVMNYFLKL